MNWSFDLSAAPRDGTHVILALPNKQTLRSYWCTPKGEPEHWCMLSHKNEPVAWMLWPEHPNLREGASEQPEAHGSSPCIGAREAHRPATYGQLVTAGETAPQFIIDDVGGF